MICKHTSHLLQMRGLKLDRPQEIFFSIQSHLLQMRGLKHLYQKTPLYILSRIFYRCVD